MSIWTAVIVLFSVITVFSIIHRLSGSNHPIKRSFLSASCGAATLLAVNLTSIFTGVTLPVSLISLFVSIIGGIPGVTLMLALNLYF